jgi:hypothetical protein
MADVICKVIQEHQEKVATITPEIVKQFFNRKRDFDMSIPVREEIKLESDEVYKTYGINFDITFGAIAPDGASEYESEQIRLINQNFS